MKRTSSTREAFLTINSSGDASSLEGNRGYITLRVLYETPTSWLNVSTQQMQMWNNFRFDVFANRFLNLVRIEPLVQYGNAIKTYRQTKDCSGAWLIFQELFPIDVENCSSSHAAETIER